MVEAYCVKCKSKKTMKNARSVKTKHGRDAVEGECPTCGIKMYLMGNKPGL